MRTRVRYLAGRRVDTRIRKTRVRLGSGRGRSPLYSGAVTQSTVELARVDREFDQDAAREEVSRQIDETPTRLRDVRLADLPRFIFTRRVRSWW